MWICPVCKEKCDDDAEFCIMCGTRNPIIAGKALNSSNYNWICPSCGNECATDATFCINCGTPRSGISEKKTKAVPEPQKNEQSNDTLVERGMMDLSDEDWDSAKNFFNQALNIDPKSAEANLGMFMAINSLPTEEAVKEKLADDFDDTLKNNKYWKRTKQFAAGSLKEKLVSWEVRKEGRKVQERKQEETKTLKEGQKSQPEKTVQLSPKTQLGSISQVEATKDEKRKKIVKFKDIAYYLLLISYIGLFASCYPFSFEYEMYSFALFSYNGSICYEVFLRWECIRIILAFISLVLRIIEDAIIRKQIINYGKGSFNLWFIRIAFLLLVVFANVFDFLPVGIGCVVMLTIDLITIIQIIRRKSMLKHNKYA